MRITGPFPPIRTPSSAAARVGEGGFKLSDPAARPRATGVAGIAPLSVPALGVDPDERRRRGVRKGRVLLDLLDSLKAAMLGQQDTSQALAGLAGELGGLEAPDDERLADILDDVRVRSEVELAKAEVAGRKPGR